ncbi:ring-infected erythrocyte surface antigen-like [Diabrotica virgifera virgifera]|uniref:Uncharacterized protein n=1 Tax=Diabrotica virgifera virgifera TaxID=50390 RepID=A0ABM5KCY2_DIAVI|nr:ring-infected erythrocyte surface antigen-like [Diabrotica virgifera virgifera]
MLVDLEDNQNEIPNVSNLFEDLDQLFPTNVATNSTSTNVDLRPQYYKTIIHTVEEEVYVPDKNYQKAISDDSEVEEDTQSNKENDEEYVPDSNPESEEESDNEDIQPNNTNIMELDITEADNNIEENLQKRKRKKTNQRQLNKN